MEVDWPISRESRDDCIEKNSFERTNARQMCRNSEEKLVRKKLPK